MTARQQEQREPAAQGATKGRGRRRASERPQHATGSVLRRVRTRRGPAGDGPPAAQGLPGAPGPPRRRAGPRPLGDPRRLRRRRLPGDAGRGRHLAARPPGRDRHAPRRHRPRRGRVSPARPARATRPTWPTAGTPTSSTPSASTPPRSWSRARSSSTWTTRARSSTGCTASLAPGGQLILTTPERLGPAQRLRGHGRGRDQPPRPRDPLQLAHADQPHVPPRLGGRRPRPPSSPRSRPPPARACASVSWALAGRFVLWLERTIGRLWAPFVADGLIVTARSTR